MTKMDISTGIGATYRYYTGRTLYPFGHGLSYTSFSLTAGSKSGGFTLDTQSTAAVHFNVTVANTGNRAGTETIMAFFEPKNGASPLKRQMFDFEKIRLEPNQSMEISFNLTAASVTMARPADGDLCIFPGQYQLVYTNGVNQTLTTPLTLTGSTVVVEKFPIGAA